VMIDSIKHFNKLREKGTQVSEVIRIKDGLSVLLKLWNREADVKVLPNVANRSSATNKAFHIETELKPLSKILVRGALAFQEAIEKNNLLDIHPFFDEELFSEQAKIQGWKPPLTANKKYGFKKCMIPVPGTIKYSPLPLERLHRQVFYNQASRNWFFVFSMLTG
ncbi:hypothetical protein EAY15_23150, partial [Vibrio anguillarum]|nr:hypothetical protein [Vibrio anguillarum]